MSDGAGPFAGPVRHVYVHVPFCRERCDYCDFASTAIGSDAGCRGAGVDEDRARLLDSYVAAVAAEWERRAAAHDVRRLETLYIGGGTPSLLGPERLERLLEPFRPFLTPAAEVTVETNPEDVDEAYARWAATWRVAVGTRRAGRVQQERRPVHRGLRVSLGAQSFDRRRRAALGRRAAADPITAYRRLRDAGVGSVGIDLIFGIPGQTVADLDDDIAAVLALQPDHVSWYELDVVEGTALAERLRRAAAPESAVGPAAPAAGRGDGGSAAAVAASSGTPLGPLPGDDERAAMYRRLVRALSRAGYSWYEVSNFALPGRRARHNVAYWRARPYLGLGAGAVATVGRRRTTTTRDLDAYLAALSRGEAPSCEVEELSEIDLARERLMLAARCGLRVPLGEVGAALAPEALPPLAAAGMISLHGGTIAVTRKGRYLANEVSVRLYRV